MRARSPRNSLRMQSRNEISCTTSLVRNTTILSARCINLFETVTQTQALYWMGRMIEGGEDPLYIARRLVRFASEDVGLASPRALEQAVAAFQACRYVGLPEAALALAQVVVFLATSPKSNSLEAAYIAVKEEIARTGHLPVPLHLRNAPTGFMKGLGYGKGYLYAHDFPDAKVEQEHFPPQLKGRRFYRPTDRGFEKTIRERMGEEGDREE